MKGTTCCFIGHRKIKEGEKLKKQLYLIVEVLILNKGVDTFLFGSKSEFNDLCYEVVTELKAKHPHIKRIYVRAQFPYIDDDYKNYLLESYEETYFPDRIINAGKASYIERNYEMIDKSDFCVIYYDKNYSSNEKKFRQSGTELAYIYAKRRGIWIENTHEN